MAVSFRFVRILVSGKAYLQGYYPFVWNIATRLCRSMMWVYGYASVFFAVALKLEFGCTRDDECYLKDIFGMICAICDQGN